MATGSVANRRALFSQVHSGFEAPGPPWYTPLIPSMMCRTHFLRMTWLATTWGMNWFQTLVSFEKRERFTLLTDPWLLFLSARVTPAEPWSLSTGSRTILL